MDLTKKYINQAHRITDVPSLLLLRYFRTRPIGTHGLLSIIKTKLLSPFIFRSKAFNGLKIAVNPADFTHIRITDEFLIEPIYDLKLVKFKPDCIIDCGAHIGMFTVLCGSVYPGTPIYSFEPNPSNLEYLKKQLLINQLNNVCVEPSAVSNYKGTATFEDGEVSFGGHLSRDTPTETSYQVDVINFIEYLKNISCELLLLKMDIEGEEDILLPALLEHLPNNCAIFFEYHFGIANFNILKEKLEMNQFEIKINRSVENTYLDVFAQRLRDK